MEVQFLCHQADFPDARYTERPFNPPFHFPVPFKQKKSRSRFLNRDAGFSRQSTLIGFQNKPCCRLWRC
ncbi:hypothetical protein MR060_02170, partial [bacterium]|nr:hypothetical protein [bacterium]